MTTLVLLISIVAISVMFYLSVANMQNAKGEIDFFFENATEAQVLSFYNESAAFCKDKLKTQWVQPWMSQEEAEEATTKIH